MAIGPNAFDSGKSITLAIGRVGPKWHSLPSLPFQGPSLNFQGPSLNFQGPPLPMALEMEVPASKLLRSAPYQEH
jgi:hypothetical protein